MGLFGKKNHDEDVPDDVSWLYDDEDEDEEDDEPEEEYIDFVFTGFEYEGDDSDGEGLDASDASYIWMSSGKDEDYTFGYTEDELENA